jgi:hypothetical protein
VDAFDLQFGLTDSGPSLAAQYGPATSFLTVLNQYGQTTSLPGTDPSGAGTDNWEVEASLDVEWAHAIAPGAQIVLVEANSQSLADLMAAVGTAASQPGVSVVTMSWGFPEGQAVFAADEAHYDNVFNVPGVTFLASTGDYGVADPEYPAFSPNVVAVGGTSLNLNADGSYNNESGWGYYSNSMGTSIGSGGGLSQYESEPSYQQGVQSTGSRTTPDVSLVADPATGAWIADTYNLGVDNPFEAVGGTSLAAPAFAGLIALVNQGRVAAGAPVLNSTSPTEAQQALYSLPQADYNIITSGSNGYNAHAGYNLVTGLGTPVANRFIPDLVAYSGPGTTYGGPKVGALQDATLVSTGWGGSGTPNVFGVFNSLTVSSSGLAHGEGSSAASAISMPTAGTLVQDVVASHSLVTPVMSLQTTLPGAAGSTWQPGSVPDLGRATHSSLLGQTSPSPARVTIAPVAASLAPRAAATSTAQAAWSAPRDSGKTGGAPATHRDVLDGLIRSGHRTSLLPDGLLDDLAADAVLGLPQQGIGVVTMPLLPTDGATRDPVLGDPLSQPDQSLRPADGAAGLAVLALAIGFWAGGTSLRDARKRPSGRPFSRRPWLWGHAGNRVAAGSLVEGVPGGHA